MKSTYCKLALALFPLIATGCTAQKLHWQNTKSVAYTDVVPEGRSSVVIYRQDGAIEGPTVNTYINGEYLASLQPNAYRQETVCAENQRLYAEFTHQDPGYREKAKDGTYYDLPVNAVSFFKVVSHNGRPALQAVAPEQAKEELKGLPEQTHTLARVDHLKSCPKVLKKYNLEASALFKFNRADYQNMLPKGKQEIAEVAADIKQNLDKIADIVVVGHTDPEGNDAYNLKLSTKRADTVKRALTAGGIDGRLIKAEGRGETELLIANCRELHPKNAKARQMCNQPNRRVSIVVHGTQE
ncbi:OmpA family protein [Avibacterium sp. 21-586]|uniref:OmpA family protein n=1 Tax=Avibacterium sp. 21-586 TaxID=2911534 RepID=UPI0022464AB0|nr:OmpA family protein [Avibacterium sp. 21-586]MCW9709968.1 OmpA family protein [Avibacterium sp. 21-586]